MELLGMITLRNWIINIGIRNWSKIDISKILQNNLSNAEESWSVKHRKTQKMQSRSRDLTKFTRWCHFINMTKFQVFLISRTEIGILSEPDQSPDFERFFTNMVRVVLIFG